MAVGDVAEAQPGAQARRELLAHELERVLEAGELEPGDRPHAVGVIEHGDAAPLERPHDPGRVVVARHRHGRVAERGDALEQPRLHLAAVDREVAVEDRQMPLGVVPDGGQRQQVVVDVRRQHHALGGRRGGRRAATRAVVEQARDRADRGVHPVGVLVARAAQRVCLIEDPLELDARREVVRALQPCRIPGQRRPAAEPAQDHRHPDHRRDRGDRQPPATDAGQVPQHHRQQAADQRAGQHDEERVDDQAAQRAVEVLAQQRDLGVAAAGDGTRHGVAVDRPRLDAQLHRRADHRGPQPPVRDRHEQAHAPLARCADGELEAHRGDVRVIGDRPDHARCGPRARERADRNDETEDDATPHAAYVRTRR